MTNQTTINNKLKEIKTEKYIGIPYVVNGRDFNSIDCYGLVRLVYKEELGIDLPSFIEEGINPSRTQELISQYKEGWEPTESVSTGDVVIFKIMGVDAHIAVAISETHFLHARNGHESAIESFASAKWKSRLVGSYKYSPKASVVLNGIPHPLRTERITTAIPAGTNIIQLEDWIIKEYSIQPELKPLIRVIVNGVPIPDAMKEATIIQEHDCIEYRVLAQGDSVRTVLMIAVVIAVAYATGGGSLAAGAGLGWGASAGAALGIGTAAGSAIVGIGLTAVGMALVDAIAPVRMPTMNSPTDPGSAERQLMITGGANRPSPYGSIPFILGKVRVTPPLGANTYSLFSADGAESYLRMLLVWGYGPLYVDESTLKIGELPISNYVGVNQLTLNRITEPSSAQLAAFNGLYGTDTTQISSNVELTCDGVAGVTTSSYKRSQVSTVTNSTSFTLPSNYVAGSLIAYQVQTAGRNSGATFETAFSIAGSTVTFYPSQPGLSISIDYQVDVLDATVSAGPWLTSTSTDGSCSDFNLAVHFPQGCRKIASTGDSAGKSFIAPVNLEIEYKKASAATWISAGVFIAGASAAKDAFTWVKKITYESSENIQVRIRRLTGTGNTVADDPNYQWLFTSILLSTTFSRNALPAIDPVNCKIAKTAFEIKASDQFNSQIEGINAIVWTYGKSWNGSAWVNGNINNPAALFRHVLEHPANPRRVTDTAKLDLAQIQYWSTYCDTKGFTYNSIVGSARSVLDILRDICAAGRASPSMVDGKWTVVIDEPKPNIVQHFSPHNSWGFEGSKSLPKIPDGLRVSFINEDKDYQEAETIVYATASSESNAALLESISVPGVTKLSQAQDHARWHMAQAKLRPESYSLNTDIEYIVCNRGDRVKVMHDVPMWGLGSGRIKDIDTNLLKYSQDFTQWDGYWQRPTITNGFLAPDGTMTAQRFASLDAGLSSDSSGIIGYITGPIAGPVTVSIWLRCETGTLQMNFGNDDNYATSIIVTETWTRFELTNPSGLPSSGNIRGMQLNETTLNNTAWYAWGAQLEIGSVTTDYIPTTSTSNSRYYLDEELAMQAGVSYSLRVRNKTGGSTVRTLLPKTSDGYYSDVICTASATLDEIDTSDLFLFGTMNQESQDCIVLNIEPMTNKSARLTLVDYGVTSSANIYTDYLDYTNNLAYESNISLPPTLLIQSFGTKVPTITGIISNEKVMERVAAGVFAYKMLVSYSNATDLPASTSQVEFQWDFANAKDTMGLRSMKVPYNSCSCLITGVEEGELLRVRARYVGTDGRTSQWTDWEIHLIIGKTTAPSAVTGFTAVADTNSSKIKLSWVANTELDINIYEVRTDSNWGSTTNLVFSGYATSCFDNPTAVNTAKTYYIKAIDYSNNYSSTATSTSFTAASPVNIASATYIFTDTSLTAATVTLDWVNAAPIFGLYGYEISYDTIVKTTQSNTITLPANWLGSKTFIIKTIDNLGYKSTGYSISVTKLAPNPASNFRAQVIDNTVMLYWDLPSKTSLPIDHVLIKKGIVGSSWSTAVSIGTKSGGFTTQNETTAGIYVYYLAVIDTDGNESTPISLTTSVAQPPDFAFFAKYDSTFTGTKVSAAKEANSNTLIFPVNTTETWSGHFTSRGWVGPEDPTGTAGQVDQGYSVYIQPGNTTGYYEETFDYGTILTSSKVSLLLTGSTISGTVLITPSISVSSNGSTWIDYPGLTEVFATSFRYVKVRATANATSDTGVYSLTALQVVLDSKLLNDAGNVSALSTDTLGTIVNLNKEFVDVSSITVSPSGTTAIIPVYDFNDSVTSATYSLVSTVCTVSSVGHNLITGQKVRLGFSSGTTPNGVYTITSHSTNSFTVTISAVNASGSVETYPESFRVYLFDTSGTRVSATASWAAKGY